MRPLLLALLIGGCNNTVTTSCNNDSECDDGVYCNGAEACDTGTHKCKAGALPSCDDSLACTHDLCNELTKSCEHFGVDSECNAGESCDPAGGCIPKCKAADCTSACTGAGFAGGTCAGTAVCQCAPSPAPGTVSGSAL